MKKILLSILLTLSATCFAGSTEFKDLAELESVVQLGQPIIVLFSAKWCGPCKAFHPTFEKLSSELQIPFFTIDIDNPKMHIGQPPPVPTVFVVALKGDDMLMCEAVEGLTPHDEVLKGILECMKELKK